MYVLLDFSFRSVPLDRDPILRVQYFSSGNSRITAPLSSLLAYPETRAELNGVILFVFVARMRFEIPERVGKLLYRFPRVEDYFRVRLEVYILERFVRLKMFVACLHKCF